MIKLPTNTGKSDQDIARTFAADIVPAVEVIAARLIAVVEQHRIVQDILEQYCRRAAEVSVGHTAASSDSSAAAFAVVRVEPVAVERKELADKESVAPAFLAVADRDIDLASDRKVAARISSESSSPQDLDSDRSSRYRVQT